MVGCWFCCACGHLWPLANACIYSTSESLAAAWPAAVFMSQYGCLGCMLDPCTTHLCCILHRPRVYVAQACRWMKAGSAEPQAGYMTWPWEWGHCMALRPSSGAQRACATSQFGLRGLFCSQTASEWQAFSPAGCIQSSGEGVVCRGAELWQDGGRAVCLVGVESASGRWARCAPRCGDDCCGAVCAHWEWRYLSSDHCVCIAATAARKVVSKHQCCVPSCRLVSSCCCVLSVCWGFLHWDIAFVTHGVCLGLRVWRSRQCGTWQVLHLAVAGCVCAEALMACNRCK